MKSLKLWYFVCFVFGFYSLDTLVKESHEVVYEKITEKDEIQFLFCKELSWFYPRKTVIDLKNLKGDLLRYFTNSDNKNEVKQYLKRFKVLLLDRTKAGGYLIFNDFVCLIFDDLNQLKGVNQVVSLEAVFFAIKRVTFDFVRMKSIADRINQLTVLKKPHPYSNCDKSNSRFHCLNECSKREFRSSRYFYDSNDTGVLQLNYEKSKRTSEESERNCFNECKRENCKMIKLMAIDRFFDFSEENKEEALEAQPKLSDYWMQLIGLICSFAGLSLHQFIWVTIDFAQSKVRRRTVKISLACLKWVILLLSLACFCYLANQRMLDHKTEERNPKGKITRNKTKPTVVNLAICVDIKKYVEGEFEGKKMVDIEKASDRALDDAMEGIYLYYQGRSFRSNYQVKPKVLFFDYTRCFHLILYPIYQAMLSSPKLQIHFRKHFQLYLLSQNENLNQKSYSLFGNLQSLKSVHFVMKRIVKRLKSGGHCVDYKEKYANCTSRYNCVERCVSRKYFEKYNQITFGPYPYLSLVVDRDWFSSSDWNASLFLSISGENHLAYQDIKEKCLRTVPAEPACLEIKFERTAETFQANRQIAEMDLQFDIEQSVEEGPPLYKLVLDLANIQSIIFGFTVLKLLQMICDFVQPKLKINHDKVVLLLIYLFCSIGFSWHTYYIFDLAVNGRLTPTEHYELAEKIPMPEMVFCREIDQTLIDQNHKLTGDYLEELTSMLTPKTMFKSITYLNDSNEWTPFDIQLVERFFLSGMKCFQIKIDQTYRRNQFYSSNERTVLKVDFIEILAKSKIVYFMTNINEKNEFSQILNLNYPSVFFNYEIIQETTVYQYEDRFSFIRKHFHSFQENGDLYGHLFELQRNEYRLRTLNLPVKDEDFKFELDGDLFDQLYLAEKQKPKKKWTNLSYKQLFVANNLRYAYDYSEPDLTFKLVFVRKIVTSTNEENLGKLILSLLNLLFIWFDLGVLDLHSLLVKLCSPGYFVAIITQILLFSSKWLNKLKSPLYQHLNPSKQNSI